jgi:hypothetical protein
MEFLLYILYIKTNASGSVTIVLIIPLPDVVIIPLPGIYGQSAKSFCCGKIIKQQVTYKINC